MIGHSKELKKGMVYTAEDWDAPMYRIQHVKHGREQTIITRAGGEKEILSSTQAVRFFNPGDGPSKFGES